MPIRRSPNGARHVRPQPGRNRPERWSRSIGTPGRNQLEQVVAITRCARKHPFDAGPGGIALSFLGSDLGYEALLGGNPPVEALTAQHTDLDLDHVQPAGVLGNRARALTMARS